MLSEDELSMQMQQQKQHVGLVADLMPNIRLMRFFGHYMHRYSSGSTALGNLYSTIHLFLFLLQFLCILVNLILNRGEADELTANTITLLHFAHTIAKFCYLGLKGKEFYTTLNIWNQPNSHPLFAESSARYHSIALAGMRKNLYFTLTMTTISIISWITITFYGESVKGVFDKSTNETYYEEVPRLPFKSFYPWDAMSGMAYFGSFLFQIYFLVFSMMTCNLADDLFCSWLCFACEELQHLKTIMKPLMELSSTLDTFRPNSAALFRSHSGTSKSGLVNDEEFQNNENSELYRPTAEWGDTIITPSNGQNPVNPNGLSQKQFLLVRSAIKYWVERHKHVIRLASAIDETYGFALLMHMLISTIALTLLAYQLTKINGINVYTFTTLGYLFYSLGQVYYFCENGNRLMEESSSVIEAAYSCHWYDGSEEAKTFVQVLCQKCQQSLSISGAKFFIVSLDLFASVLGAVATYFIVLIQLN